MTLAELMEESTTGKKNTKTSESTLFQSAKQKFINQNKLQQPSTIHISPNPISAKGSSLSISPFLNHAEDRGLQPYRMEAFDFKPVVAVSDFKPIGDES